MDPLTQLLVNRQVGAQAQQPQAPPTPTPVVPPSGGQTNTPPQAKRFSNAVQIMNAYRNGYPNPVLLQASLRG